MRNAFASELTALAASHPGLVLLSGDIGNKLFDGFKDVARGRFYNCGVAEANMMGVAAGMALSGLHPVVYTIAPFTTTRCFEQIRIDVCYHKVPVIIVGTGAGLSYAELGPTHHSLEDMAILRSLPGMRVVAPCDARELRLSLRAALANPAPTYIRIGKKGEPAIHADEPAFILGRALVIRPGMQVAVLVAGTIMTEALKSADLLAARGISVEVASLHTVKPLDQHYLTDVFSRCKLVVTIEEHGCIGGLGAAVAEWRADTEESRVPLLRFGTPDQFMHEVGSQDYARRKYGLEANAIAERIVGVLTAHERVV